MKNEDNNNNFSPNNPADSVDRSSKNVTSKGSNPNRYAKNRKFYIPKKKNEPGKTYFADPDPNFKPLYDEGFSFEKESNIIGDFLVKSQFPFEIAKPYAENMMIKMAFQNNQRFIIREAVNQLFLCTYISAISNILNSANPRVYKKYKPLKSIVQTEEIELPNFINAYLGILGDIESKLGRLEMKYAGVYLESWVTLAHDFYNNQRNAGNADINIQELCNSKNFPVWNTVDGQDYIIQKFCAWYNKHLGEFAVMNHDHWIMVSTPKITLANFDVYEIHSEYQFQDIDRELIIQTFNSIKQWIQGNEIINVRINNQFFDLRNNFDLAIMVKNVENDITIMKKHPMLFYDFFNHSERITTKQGSVIQLISQGSSDQIINSPVPLSDGEAFAGYVTTPCEEYHISPKYRIHFEKRKNEIENIIVEKDLKAYQKSIIAGRY